MERNLYEWRYYEVAEQACPGLTPRLLGQDTELYLFAMEYLEPQRYPLWKSQLRDGRTDTAFGRSVGVALARVHSYSAARPQLATLFPSDDKFYASRMESYLEATARAHSGVGAQLHELIHMVMATKHALVHGDVSPKNILNGPTGPVFLDAECAFYGDPAFDLAFCLNHLLLKCLWRPNAREGFMLCFKEMADGYLERVDWEGKERVETRAAHLLPGLFLARIDGKSPVEYLTQERDKELVRSVATALLVEPTAQLSSVAARWAHALDAH